MCIICVDFQKGLLTLEEAWKNLKEANYEDDHASDVLQMLYDAATGGID